MPDQALARPVGDFQFEVAALALIAAKRSEHTKSAYRADLRRWLDFCHRIGVNPVGPPLDATIAFRDHLGASLSNESARRVLAAMSSIYRALLAGRAVRVNPFHPAVLAWPPANALPKTRLVSDANAQAMIADAVADTDPVRGARDTAVLQLLWDTGLRRASVAQIVRASYRDGAVRAIVKGAKEVEIRLPPSTIAAIDRWLTVAPPSPYLFAGTRGAINVATINKIVKLRAKAVSAGHVHPHCFRAAFVTASYDAGLPEHEIQASVHHSDPKTTRRYDRGARGMAVPNAVAVFRGQK
jgi:integrase/recombinase XerD